MKRSLINSVDFTLLASEKLSSLELDTERQQQVRAGDHQVINEIFEEILERPHTLGDFLKRYIADVTYQEYDDISDEALLEFIKHAFAENHMENIGSLKPGATTVLSQRLEAWLKSPVTAIDRQTIFLFCFGLNMDEETASFLLTQTFRTNDFYVRDYKEVIYYYCLKHNLQYPGMLDWMKYYDELEVTPDIAEYKATSILNNSFSDFRDSFERNDPQFLSYLATLKKMPCSNKITKSGEFKKQNRSSHHEMFKQLMSGLESVLYDKCDSTNKRALLTAQRTEKLLDAENRSIESKLIDPQKALAQMQKQKDSKKKDIDRYQRLLKSANSKNISELLEIAPFDNIIIPYNIKQLIDLDMIRFPSFSHTNLKKKLEDRRDPITRTDILFAAFLLCTADNDFSEFPSDLRHIRRRIDFEETVNSYLETCGYGELYLLNPLELLLVFCLYQERPFEYLMALWHYSKNR